MSALLSSSDIEKAFLSACHDELAALKPGNVHIHAPGYGMEVAHFEAAAKAAAPHIANLESTVGTRILQATKSSFDAANCNTNLGIILLTAPLAHAANGSVAGKCLRARLTDTLNALTIDDATKAFSAISYANPAGLGRVPNQDVSEPATETLLQAMMRAADRDRIARAYATGFSDIFDVGLPTLADARLHCREVSALAITTLHMSYLSAWPDSHIRRKFGEEAALALKDRINRLRPLFEPAATPKSHADLLALDQQLKAKGLNPGTTADLVVATLFTERLNAMISSQNNA